MPSALHVTEKPLFTHLFICQNHICRLTVQRINRHHGNHVSNPEARIYPMPYPDSFGAGYHLIVRALIHRLLRLRILPKVNAPISPPKDIVVIVHLIVDFVKSHPVFDFILISFKTSLCKFKKKINCFPVCKSTISLCEVIGHFKMR